MQASAASACQPAHASKTARASSCQPSSQYTSAQLDSSSTLISYPTRPHPLAQDRRSVSGVPHLCLSVTTTSASPSSLMAKADAHEASASYVTRCVFAAF